MRVLPEVSDAIVLAVGRSAMSGSPLIQMSAPENPATFRTDPRYTAFDLIDLAR